jgi:hypothetical protein
MNFPYVSSFVSNRESPRKSDSKQKIVNSIVSTNLTTEPNIIHRFTLFIKKQLFHSTFKLFNFSISLTCMFLLIAPSVFAQLKRREFCFRLTCVFEQRRFSKKRNQKEDNGMWSSVMWFQPSLMKKYLDSKQRRFHKKKSRDFSLNLGRKTEKWHEKINIIKWKMRFCDVRNFYLIERKESKKDFHSRKAERHVIDTLLFFTQITFKIWGQVFSLFWKRTHKITSCHPPNSAMCRKQPIRVIEIWLSTNQYFVCRMHGWENWILEKKFGEGLLWHRVNKDGASRKVKCSAHCTVG